MKRMKCQNIATLIMVLALLVSNIEITWAKKNPNIILIMTDDQGWFDAGFNGNEAIKTPHLDALASKGVIFDRFYSASAVCSPTRASVITGRNPYRIGIPDANSGHMKKEEVTLAELVKEKGYATGHFGKWHLGTLTQKEVDANRGGKEKFFGHFSIPSMHGYDEFFCTESKVPTYDPTIKPVNFPEGESLKYGWTAVKKGDSKEKYGTSYWVGEEIKDETNVSGEDTKVLMDRVLPFINKAAKNDKPFFTTIWPHTPHLPVVAAKKYKDLYWGYPLNTQLYYGSITAMDEQVGRLWAELERLGIAENTMIWFCSDNGPEGNTPGSQGHFKGRKRSLYEGGLRTPAFVVWKDQLKGNRRVDFPAYTSDYLPTILNVLDIQYPDNRPVDGMNVLPLINKEHAKREKPMGFRYKKQISWVSHQYKLITKNEGKSYELYDLLKDEKEQHNLINDLPEMTTKMKKELDNWLISIKNSSRGKDY